MSIEPVVISNAHVDPHGADVVAERGEFIVVENVGDQSVDLAAWTLRDAAGAVIEFPPAYVLPAGGRLRVYSGPGQNATDRLYAGRRRAFLNNRGDSLELRDDQGQTAHVFVY